MAKKKTAASVSSIAARVLATDNPLDGHRGAIAVAIQECGLPLSERAVTGFVDRIEAALAPMLEDMKTLAGSALSQDEDAKVKDWGERHDEERKAAFEAFDAGDEELEGN